MVKKAKKEEVAVPVPKAEVAKPAKKSKPATPAAVVQEKPKKEEKKIEDVNMSDDEVKEDHDGGEESQTVKEKKENARRMLKAVKAFNAKIKTSIERKDIIRAVQALQGYYKKLKGESAKGTKQLLEVED